MILYPDPEFSKQAITVARIEPKEVLVEAKTLYYGSVSVLIKLCNSHGNNRNEITLLWFLDQFGLI